MKCTSALHPNPAPRCRDNSQEPRDALRIILSGRELLPQYPARSAFYLFGDKAQGVFGRVLEEYVDMVYVHSYINDLDTYLRACAPDDHLSDKTDLAGQYLPLYFGVITR